MKLKNITEILEVPWEYSLYEVDSNEYVLCVVCFGAAGSEYQICIKLTEDERSMLSSDQAWLKEFSSNIRASKNEYEARQFPINVFAEYKRRSKNA